MSLDCQTTLVIPVFNAASTVEPVFRRLGELPASWQIVVVDDGSTDGTVGLVRHLLPRAQLCQNPHKLGASAARNLGASRSEGEYIVFLDSDVEVVPETLQGLVDYLQLHPDHSGVFGCYSPADRNDEGPLSRFRNLLHRYFHLNEPSGPVPSFWSGLGAIRASEFRRVGGFNVDVKGIEDVELGKRLSDAGCSIYLDHRFQGQHLKRWSWRSMIMTDVVMRAAPWTRLGLQGRVPTSGMNLSPRFKAGPPLLGLGLSTWLIWPTLSALACLLYLLVNAPLYFFMVRTGGLTLGLRSVFYLAVHHVCCGLGFLLGVWQHLRAGRGAPSP